MGKRGAVREFAAIVRTCRVDRGWSQEELAFQAGLHRNYISGLERGTRNPSLTTIASLAEAFGLTPAALLSRLDKAGR